MANLFEAVGTVWHVEPAEDLHKDLPSFLFFICSDVSELKDQSNRMCPSHVSQFVSAASSLSGSILRNQASLTSLTVYKRQADAFQKDRC